MLAFVSVSKSFNIHTPRYSVKHLIFNSRRASYDSKDLGNIFIKDLCRDATESRGLAAKTLEDIRYVYPIVFFWFLYFVFCAIYIYIKPISFLSNSDRFYSRDFLDIAIMPSTGPSSGPVGATSSASLAIPRGGSGGRDLFPARGSFSIKGSGRILQNNANDRRGGGLDVNRNKRRAIDAPSWDRAPPSKRQRSPPGHRSRSRSRSRSPPASSSNQKSPSSPAARRMSKSPTPRGAGWD